MKKTNYSKFMASAATLALVATAVAPAAGAQTSATASSYIDVSVENDHFDNIYKAQELGFMRGNVDGTFKPAVTVTRSNAVKTLARYVAYKEGKTVETYDVSGVTPFSDVPASISDKELYNASLVVKKAGIFTGDSNNNFKLNPLNKMTRQQMAKVLVNAFELQDLPDKTSKVTDNNRAIAEYREAINILSENGVTTQSVFMPAGNTSRAQFASFVVRAYYASNPTEAAKEEVIADFETEMGGFQDLANDYGVDITVDFNAYKTFNVELPADLPEVEGTGFFDSLAEQGIKTIKVNDTTFTISDGEGNVTEGAGAAKDAILQAMMVDQTFELTVDLPFGEQIVSETYTFNVEV